MSSSAPTIDRTPVAAALDGAGMSSPPVSSSLGAYRPVDLSPVGIDMRSIMRRLYASAKLAMQSAGHVSAEAGRRLVQMMRALWDAMLSFMRWIARKLGATVSGPTGAGLTEQQARGEAPLSAVAQGGHPPASAMGIVDDGTNEVQPHGADAPAGDSQTAAAAGPGLDLDKDFGTVVPSPVVAGVIGEKLDALVEHVQQPGRPCLSMLADPETAAEWAALSLEQLDAVRHLHEQQIHVRREEMEKLIADLAVQESTSPEAVMMVLESSGAPAMDPQGRYQLVKEEISRVRAEMGAVEMAMKAILAMPAAQSIPPETRKELCAKLGIEFKDQPSAAEEEAVATASDARDGDATHTADREGRAGSAEPVAEVRGSFPPLEPAAEGEKVVVSGARMDHNTKVKANETGLPGEESSTGAPPPPPESSPLSRVVHESVFSQRLRIANSRKHGPDGTSLSSAMRDSSQ